MGLNPGLDASQRFILQVDRADRIRDILLNVAFRIAISNAKFIFHFYIKIYTYGIQTSRRGLERPGAATTVGGELVTTGAALTFTDDISDSSLLTSIIYSIFRFRSLLPISLMSIIYSIFRSLLPILLVSC